MLVPIIAIILVFTFAYGFMMYNRTRMNNAFTTEELKNIVIESISKVGEYNNRGEIVVGNFMKIKNTITTKKHVYSTYVIDFKEGSSIIDIFYFNTDSDESTYYGTIDLSDTTLNFKLKYKSMLSVYDKNEQIMDIYKSQVRQRTDIMMTYPQDEEFDKFYNLINGYNLVK